MGQLGSAYQRRCLHWSTVILISVAILTGCKQSADENSSNSAERFVWSGADKTVPKVSAGPDTLETIWTLSDESVHAAIDDTRDSAWVVTRSGRLVRLGVNGTEELSLLLPGKSANVTTRVVADKRDGSVWVGQDKTLLKYSRNGNLLSTSDLAHTIQDLALDIGKGVLWVATSRNLFSYDAASAEVLRKLSTAVPGTIQAIDFDLHSGVLWVGYEKAIVRYSRSGTFEKRINVPHLKHLASDGHGGLWMTHDRRLYHYSGSGVLNAEFFLDSLAPSLNGSLTGVAADVNDGRLWVVTHNGLAVVDAEGTAKTVLNDLNKTSWVAANGDINPPWITIEEPEGDDLVGSEPELKLAFGDIGVGVDTTTFELRVNERLVPISCEATGPQQATCTPDEPLTGPAPTLAITVADAALNRSAAASVTVRLDTDGDGTPDELDPSPNDPPPENGSGGDAAVSALDFLDDYEVYRVDVDSDGLKDILFRPVPKIIMILLDDLLFPADTNQQPVYYLKATTDWGGYLAPEIWEGGTPGARGSTELNVYVGNTDLDTSTAEILIQPEERGTSAVTLSYGSGSMTLLDEMELGLVDGYDISAESSDLTLADENGDGRDDLSITNRLDERTTVVHANADGTFGTPMDESDIEMAAVWFMFLSALGDGHPETAAGYFREDRYDEYLRVFQALREELPGISSEFRYFRKVQGNEVYAVYAVNRFIDENDRLFFVTFTRNGDGEWEIVSL